MDTLYILFSRDTTRGRLDDMVVEGNTKPAAPIKKFYKKESESNYSITENAPEIPPRSFLAPKLPMRPSNINNKTGVVTNRTIYPLEDNIYTGLKPQLTTTKFYYSNTPIQQNGQLPADFVLKSHLEDVVIGLQQGKILVLGVDKMVTVNCSSDAVNRQFYELIPFKKNSFLAFQDTGNIFKVNLNDAGDLKINLLLRGSIPLGTSKILLRPEVEEIWVVGRRETSILLLNRKDEDLALVERVASHFPESTSLSFLGSEDLAVIQRDRSIRLFTISKFGHRPALIANLPSVIGEIVKILKITNQAYATIYSDGKMIIWKFEKEALKEKITVPLTLFRIQTVHVVSDLIWLGLSNGKILILKTGEEEQKILAETKFHQATVTKFIKNDGNVVGSLDSSGQLCLWDENLTFYKQNQLFWEREGEYFNYERVTLRICSWNAAAQNPNDCCDGTANKWLGLEGLEEDKTSSEDLLVISLQEIVDLNARTFISSGATANGTGTNQSQSALDQWIRFVQKRLPNEYKLVHSSVMVGLGLIVFCKDSVRGMLSSVSDDAVKTGLGGLHGNKGGLVWRTFIYDCPIAVVACHLAAGQSAVSERNNDAATILRTATLAEAAASRRDPFTFETGNSGTKLFDHSAIFIAGDLNYRIEMDRQECLNLISEQMFDKLEEKDQLSAQMKRKELLLSYFREKPPKFLPTYKYDRGTVDRFDSSEKGRVPAWCDRILFYAKKRDMVLARGYESVPEATLSDHKPIYAIFELKCRIKTKN